MRITGAAARPHRQALSESCGNLVFATRWRPNPPARPRLGKNIFEQPRLTGARCFDLLAEDTAVAAIPTS